MNFNIKRKISLALICFIFTFFIFLFLFRYYQINVFANNTEYYCYMTQDEDSWGVNNGVPCWAAYFKYSDNSNLECNWVNAFVPGINQIYFCYYYSENKSDLYFTVTATGGQGRRKTPYSFSDMELLDSWTNSYTIKDKDIFEVSVNDKRYYVYCSLKFLNSFNNGHGGIFNYFSTNIKFKLYNNYQSLSLDENYQNIVADLMNGKNYNGDSFGDYFLDANGNIVEKPTFYDLEVPLNVKCKYYDKTIGDVFTYGDAYYKITWKQSDNVDVQGWTTEICLSQKVKYGKYQWSVLTSPHTFESKYHKIDEVQNYLGIYKKKWSDKDLNKDVMEELYNYVENEKGYHPMSTSVQNTNFCIRNKFVDSNGITHYSDYVYLKEDDDGNYTASVISSQHVDEKGGITNIDYGTEDSIVDVNNENYVNSDVSSNDTVSFSSGVSTIKNLFTDLKEFPKLLADMFSFIPGQFFYALTAMLIVLIPIAIIKLVL